MEYGKPVNRTNLSPHENKAILKFLDSLYHEIASIEMQYGLKISETDLRPPIDQQHDAVRLLTAMSASSSGAGNSGAGNSGASAPSDSPRLGVVALSGDMDTLRNRTSTAALGSACFLPQSDLLEAKSLKYNLLMAPEKLDAAEQFIIEELMRFVKCYIAQGRTTSQSLEEIEAIIEERGIAQIDEASRKITKKYQPTQFINELRNALSEYAEFRNMAGADNYIEHSETPEKPAGLLGRLGLSKQEKPLKLAPLDKIKRFFIQISHPLNLVNSLQNQSNNLGGFMKMIPDKFINEEIWKSRKPDAENLTELYGRYTLLFAALVQNLVNRDFEELLEELNQFVSDAASLQALIVESLYAQSKDAEINPNEIEQLINQVSNESLKVKLMIFLHELSQVKQRRNRFEILESTKMYLDELMKSADNTINELDKKHMTFLSGQMMVYQQSQDIVKAFATQGLNLAGQFIASETARGTGRGVGGSSRGR
jgi:hypothetical protein